MDRKNMLEFMLDARLEEVSELTEHDLMELNDKTKNNEVFEKLQNYIDSLHIPISTKNKLSDLVFDLESSDFEKLAYFNFKYYKAGFSDAVNLIFDAKEYKK